MPTILLMSTQMDRSIRLSQVLQREGYGTLSARSPDAARESLRYVRPDAIVVDLPGAQDPCGAVCGALRDLAAAVPIVVLAYRPEAVVGPLRQAGIGAEVLPSSPLRPDDVTDRLRRYVPPHPPNGTDYGQFDGGAAPPAQ